MTHQEPSGSTVLIAEQGPFADRPAHGVSHDGRHLWVAAGDRLHAVDTEREEIVHTLDVAADAGTAFDGVHLYQLAGEFIQKIDAQSGEVVHKIPAPGNGRDSGLTWAEGALWVGQYRDRKIHCIDPETGEIRRTIESDRFVTGVTWSGGELWHATWEGEHSDLRRVDPNDGTVLEKFDAPAGVGIAGLSTDGENFFCGGGPKGTVRTIRKPNAAPK